MPTVEEIKPPNPTVQPSQPSEEKKKQEKDERVVTSEIDLQQVEKLIDTPDRHYIRTTSRDKTLHRILHVFPRFTGATGEDMVDHPRDPKVKAQFCQWICVIERFRLIRQGRGEDRKTERETLGVFNMPALDFISEFESAD